MDKKPKISKDEVSTIYRLKDDNDEYGYLETTAYRSVVEYAIIKVQKYTDGYNTDDLVEKLRSMGFKAELRAIVDINF